MSITNSEREEINNAAKFLINIGYCKLEDQYSIKYTLNGVSINIVYPPNSEESEVNIHFITTNQFYSVGWIALVRDNIQGSNNKLANVKELLNYVENNYLQITNYKFCQTSQTLIDHYVKNNHKIFENSISDFLKNNK